MLDDIDDTDAKNKLHELQALLHNLGVDMDEQRDIFGTTPGLDDPNENPDEQELQMRRDGTDGMEPELLGWTNPHGNDQQDPSIGSAPQPAPTTATNPTVDSYSLNGGRKQLKKVSPYTQQNPDAAYEALTVETK